MINTLSILIPTYNNVCLELVKSLQAQASLLYSSSDSLSLSSHFEYEILVADDGSTDERTVEGNRIINTLPRCRYIERKENVGRAAIRNFLAREAKYTWLLLVDSDLHIDHPNFLLNYLKAEGDIIVGGLKIGGDPEDPVLFPAYASAAVPCAHALYSPSDDTASDSFSPDVLSLHTAASGTRNDCRPQNSTYRPFAKPVLLLSPCACPLFAAKKLLTGIYGILFVRRTRNEKAFEYAVCNGS